MADCAQVLSTFGRLMFLLLVIAQCLLLASFPAKHRNNSAWYAFLVFVAPALGIFWWWINTSEKKMIQLFYIWFGYTWLGLVPMIGIVFGLTAEKLDRSQQFGSNELKLSLGITPVLLLLLLSSRAVPPHRRNMMMNVSFFMAIDVFDSNELLRMVIDENIENTHSFGIPRSLVRALLSFACIALLLSPLEIVGKLVKVDYMEDQELDADPDFFSLLNGVNGAIQVCLNVIVLGLRLGILVYEWDASMFIPKNIIMTFVRSLECRKCISMFRDEEVDAEEARQRNTLPPPTAPTAPTATPAPTAPPAVLFRNDNLGY